MTVEMINSDLNYYQADACEQAIYPETKWDSYLPLQLAAEAGEVAGKFAKATRKGVPVDKEAVALELGDVLWYIANLSYRLGYTLRDIADMNLDKLSSRAARGVINGDGDNR